MSKIRRIHFSSLAKTFIAVLGGNLVYVCFRGWLPLPMRHAPFHLDVGLLVDFWFCLVAWGILDLIEQAIRRWKRPRL